VYCCEVDAALFKDSTRTLINFDPGYEPSVLTAKIIEISHNSQHIHPAVLTVSIPLLMTMKASSTLRQLSRSLISRRYARPAFSVPPSLWSPINNHHVIVRSFAADSSLMSQLKDLRSMSGAPIVDCKKALAETNGNIDEALDWLRQHGAAKASKKLSGRDAEEGLVACAVSPDGKSASIVKVSSETDFAGKSDAFVKLATHVAEATLTNDADGDLSSESVMNLQANSKSVQIAMEEAIVAIRENLGVSSAVKMTATDDNSILVAYVHGKADGVSNAGSAAAIVEIAGDGVAKDLEKAQEVGKKLAMHIVAAKPAYLDANSVPEDIVAKEKEILHTQVS
jgi:translation elongation factor Ts